MSYITMDSEDADGYMSIVIGKSIEGNCKAIFGCVPEYSINPYRHADYDKATEERKGDLRYQIKLLLPCQKYLYYEEIRRLLGIGIQIAGVRAEKDGRLAVYLELSLNSYLTRSNMS